MAEWKELPKSGTIKDADIAADAAIAQSKLAANSGFTPAEHGAAKHTNVERELFIPLYDDSNANVTLYFGIQPYCSLDLADDLLSSVRANIKAPDDFVSVVSVKAIWTSGAMGNMYWKMRSVYGAHGESRTTHGESPAYGATANTGASYTNIQEPANPLTLPDLAKGDAIGLMLERDASHASDTIGASVYLLGFLFTYMAEQ